MFFTFFFLRSASAISVWVAEGHHLFQLRGQSKTFSLLPPFFFFLIALTNLYTFDTKSLKLILT